MWRRMTSYGCHVVVHPEIVQQQTKSGNTKKTSQEFHMAFLDSLAELW